MAMTPRRLFACLALARERKRGEDVLRFHIIRAAVNADKDQAEKFIRALKGG